MTDEVKETVEDIDDSIYEMEELSVEDEALI